MSQKKVDEYKNYKKNRRENIKKEKRKERLTMAAMWGAVVVFIACVGGAMGVSIYKYQAKQAALPTYGSTSFILSDMAGIQKEDTEDQTQSETVNASEEASSVESSESESASDEAAASEEASNKETLTQTENEETESESAEK